MIQVLLALGPASTLTFAAGGVLFAQPSAAGGAPAATLAVVEEGPPTAPLLPPMDELAWGALSFLVLAGLLYKLAWPAIKKANTARTERIRESLEEAERAKADAISVLETHKRQLQDVRNEAAHVIEAARQTADSLRSDLVARAHADVAEFRDRASAEIEAAKARAVADVESQVAELTAAAAEHLVRVNLDGEAHLRLIDGFINEIGAERSLGGVTGLVRE